MFAAACGFGWQAACGQVPAPLPIHSQGNPILGDGSKFSADPAPFVFGGKLYILAGQDEAPPDVNDFIMNQWQMFVTESVGSHTWQHVTAMLRPEQVFHWAAPGHAYAGQIVQARNGRFYLYAPVQEANSPNEDPFAIGVAVADSPLGPWMDAHPAGPILSQSVPRPNRIQNIDPTVWIDPDGRVYLYWGTFGQLLGTELQGDMVTPKGEPVRVTSLTGFFEAPWLFQRKGTYYMVYADNEAGPTSPCTPAIYHACIAYGTAPTALGPWTYQGVVLPPVSSTTSHPGVVEFKGKWYLVYHTADAKGGGNFRRSVAIDELHWDDQVQPARMLPVTPTVAPHAAPAPSRDVASAARASASNEPVPVQYWMAALNDGKTPKNPLPPEMWGSWTPHNPASQWLVYAWSRPVTLNASRVWFWADHPPGAGEGVAAPAAWQLQYWTGDAWQAVPHATESGVQTRAFNTVRFDAITTTCLRMELKASGHGGSYAGFGVEEWEALAPEAIPERRLPPRPGPGQSSCSVSDPR